MLLNLSGYLDLFWGCPVRIPHPTGAPQPRFWLWVWFSLRDRIRPFSRKDNSWWSKSGRLLSCTEHRRLRKLLSDHQKLHTKFKGNLEFVGILHIWTSCMHVPYSWAGRLPWWKRVLETYGAFGIIALFSLKYTRRAYQRRQKGHSVPASALQWGTSAAPQAAHSLRFTSEHHTVFLKCPVFNSLSSQRWCALTSTRHLWLKGTYERLLYLQRSDSTSPAPDTNSLALIVLISMGLNLVVTNCLVDFNSE